MCSHALIIIGVFKRNDRYEFSILDYYYSFGYFNCKEDYDFFKNINDKVLAINFTYNITNISICGINGCRKCNLNSNLEIIYKDICSKLDFSQKIKNLVMIS